MTGKKTVNSDAMIVLCSLVPVEQTEQCRNASVAAASKTENFAYDTLNYL
jgi:hypothetical protein